MNAEHLLNICTEMLLDNLAVGTTRELYANCVGQIPADLQGMLASIQDIDFHVQDGLEDKLQFNIMDGGRAASTAGELFIYRLRLENAVGSLHLFQRSEPQLRFETEIDEYAFLWPLTTLWKVSRIHWACRTADAFLQGHESALPIRL